METFCEKPTLRFVLVNVLFHQERQGALVLGTPPHSLFLVPPQESPKGSLRDLRAFGHGGGWDLNVISGSPGGGEEEGEREKGEGSQTPYDPFGVGGFIVTPCGTPSHLLQ